MHDVFCAVTSPFAFWPVWAVRGMFSREESTITVWSLSQLLRLIPADSALCIPILTRIDSDRVVCVSLASIVYESCTLIFPVLYA
jgi:hypothetical protein